MDGECDSSTPPSPVPAAPLIRPGPPGVAMRTAPTRDGSPTPATGTPIRTSLDKHTMSLGPPGLQDAQPETKR